MAKNKDLGTAKTNKKDEFYTQLTDIEKEVRHYKNQFRDKIVLCNCDDPKVSNFTKYFILNFNFLGLKKLIVTCYKNQNPDLFSLNDCEKAVYMEYSGTANANGVPDDKELIFKELKGDGDFRSPECINILKQADIVVTNPPFSLWREYIAQLVKYEKQFLIIGNINSVTYKEVYPLILAGKVWLGASIHSGDRVFNVPDDYPLKAAGCGIDKDGNKFIKVKGVRWFTNLDYRERHEDFISIRSYTPEEYPSFGNFDKCIFVKDTVDIPMDYDGLMAVPITFLDKYNPAQFELVGMTNDSNFIKANGGNSIGREVLEKARRQGNNSHITANMFTLYYTKPDGKIDFPFARIIIKRK